VTQNWHERFSLEQDTMALGRFSQGLFKGTATTASRKKKHERVPEAKLMCGDSGTGALVVEPASQVSR